jgi:hypothetical protein
MAGDKKGDKKKPISRSAKAGLQFPVGRIHRFLKVRHAPRVDTPPWRTPPWRSPPRERRRSSKPHFQTGCWTRSTFSPLPHLDRSLRQTPDVLARSFSILFGTSSPTLGLSGPAFECLGWSTIPHCAHSSDEMRLSGACVLRFYHHDRIAGGVMPRRVHPPLFGCLGQLKCAPHGRSNRPASASSHHRDACTHVHVDRARRWSQRRLHRPTVETPRSVDFSRSTAPQ